MGSSAALGSGGPVSGGWGQSRQTGVSPRVCRFFRSYVVFGHEENRCDYTQRLPILP